MALIRSLLFNGLFYGLMAVMGILCMPLAIASQSGALWSMRTFLSIGLWLLEHICGLRYEVRGPIPKGEVIIAANHQSFLDIIILTRVLPRAQFIMKRELIWMPVLGLYALRIGCIAIDRAKRGVALKKMIATLRSSRRVGGQLVIFPQGTRVVPGERGLYKIGTGVIYDAFGLDCVPVVTNAGLFWNTRSLVRKPGCAVVEFLDPIRAGLQPRDFMKDVETRIEAASDRLLAETPLQGRTKSEGASNTPPA